MMLQAGGPQVGVIVGVLVRVGVLVGVKVRVLVGVLVGVRVGVLVGVLVGVGVNWVQLLSNTATVLAPPVVAARSGVSSPLKSPTAIVQQLLDPRPKLVAAPKEPAPLPSSTDTLAETSFATARSGLPSWSKSAATTAPGVLPTV